MASFSLQHWNNARIAHLNEIENAHASVGGTAPGRRYATQQINQAYAMLLSSQFQGFCRDLHSESVDHIVRATQPAALQTPLRAIFLQGRKLDTGNPNPGNIGSDFNKFGLVFWDDVKAHSRHNESRHELLVKLNLWRNAIAHQDFDPAKLGGMTTLHLTKVRDWRQATIGLAISFDAVMKAHIGFITGTPPW